MKHYSRFIFPGVVLWLLASSCRTDTGKRPTSKTDYIPIISSVTPIRVKQGEPITCRVTCGFYEHFADITFLNFEVAEMSPRQSEIRAKAFYSNISYGISLPVVSTFDTTLILPAATSGQYLLRFYSFDKLVETDTVLVN